MLRLCFVLGVSLLVVSLCVNRHMDVIGHAGFFDRDATGYVRLSMSLSAWTAWSRSDFSGNNAHSGMR